MEDGDGLRESFGEQKAWRPGGVAIKGGTNKGPNACFEIRRPQPKTLALRIASSQARASTAQPILIMSAWPSRKGSWRCAIVEITAAGSDVRCEGLCAVYCVLSTAGQRDDNKEQKGRMRREAAVAGGANVSISVCCTRRRRCCSAHRGGFVLSHLPSTRSGSYRGRRWRLGECFRMASR